MSKNYVDDVGTLLRVPVGANIAEATSVKLYITKPNGDTATWVGTVSDCEKEIRYTIQSGDWDQDGEYYMQAYVATPGWTGRGDTASFRIFGDFE